MSTNLKNEEEVNEYIKNLGTEYRFGCFSEKNPEDMSTNLKNEEEVNEYIKNLGTEYRFGCFSEKNPEVCHLLGDYLEAISKDYQKAGRVYKSNCDDYNYAKSCHKVANYYLSGKGNLTQSQEQAIQYYEKGCGLSDMDSCFRAGVLGILNSQSKLPTRTLLQSVGNLKKSCDGKHPDACHHLSSLYMDGAGSGEDKVVKDMSQAFGYAVKACDLGNIYACVNVSIMYKRGDGVERNQAQSDKYKNIALEKKKELEKRQQQLIFQQGLKPV